MKRYDMKTTLLIIAMMFSLSCMGQFNDSLTWDNGIRDNNGITLPEALHPFWQYPINLPPANEPYIDFDELLDAHMVKRIDQYEEYCKADSVENGLTWVWRNDSVLIVPAYTQMRPTLPGFNEWLKTQLNQ